MHSCILKIYNGTKKELQFELPQRSSSIIRKDNKVLMKPSDYITELVSLLEIEYQHVELVT
jgi:hypothetical protein